MIMKKLSEDHYIVMDDSEIKEGDCIGFPNLKKFVPVQYFGGDLTGGEKKITHSTQPLEFSWGQEGRDVVSKKVYDKVKQFSLLEVKELLGVVDKAFERYPVIENDKDHNDRNYYRRSAYYQALEDNKERKYTEEDLADAINMARNEPDMSGNAIIQSLQPKTEWEVEFVDGKLKLK